MNDSFVKNTRGDVIAVVTPAQKRQQLLDLQKKNELDARRRLIGSTPEGRRLLVLQAKDSLTEDEKFEKMRLENLIYQGPPRTGQQHASYYEGSGRPLMRPAPQVEEKSQDISGGIDFAPWVNPEWSDYGESL